MWKQASWLEVIRVFDLEVDPKRSRRDDEMWIKSPFTHEEKASMHVSLSENIFKDFSSGKGGGIMQFCREMLRQKGREMTMSEVARWMVKEGIATANHPKSWVKQKDQASKQVQIQPLKSICGVICEPIIRSYAGGAYRPPPVDTWGVGFSPGGHGQRQAHRLTRGWCFRSVVYERMAKAFNR